MEGHNDFIRFKVNNILKAAPDAILVYLEPADRQAIPYQSGQFITFIIEHYGQTARRSYSLVTTPGVDPNLAILIKRRVNGEISRFLVDTLKVGDLLTALPPSGRFTIQTSPEHTCTYFFIAAGSGISPLFSLLKKVLHEEHRSQAILVYQNHDESSIIFNRELETLQQLFIGRLTLINLLSEPKSARIAPQRLNNFLLEQLVILHRNREQENYFYICGPGSFMRMAHFVLKLMGYSDHQIRKENFVVDAPPLPRLQLDGQPKNVELLWRGKSFHFTTSYPESVLQAALNHHIHLPYSCRGGRCSTCTVRCVSGSIVMSINEVLTDRDLDQGLVLTCVGYAETDVVLELQA